MFNIFETKTTIVSQDNIWFECDIAFLYVLILKFSDRRWKDKGFLIKR